MEGVLTGRAGGQLQHRDAGDPLEVVVTRVAEVGFAEAEEDGDTAAVAALVLQEVGAVLGTELGARHVAAAAAHQLGGVVVVAAAQGRVAACLAAVVRLWRPAAGVSGAAGGTLQLIPRLFKQVESKKMASKYGKQYHTKKGQHLLFYITFLEPFQSIVQCTTRLKKVGANQNYDTPTLSHLLQT